SYIPWTVKYRPRSISEYINQDEAKTLLLNWMRSWERGAPSKKSVILYGPPGVGKTSLVEAIAGDINAEIVETNASDFRRKEDIERRIKPAATKMTLSGKRRIILIDEVDGLSGTADKGGIESLLELISITKHPIIMTANNPFHPDLRPIRDASTTIELKKLHQRDVINVLKRICERENVQCEEEALKIIHGKNEGDLRASINDLQGIAQSFGKVTASLANELIYYRDREINPFDTLRTIFTSRSSWQSKLAISHSQVDTDSLIEWISENIPVQLTEPEDIYLAYQSLSRADVYRGRMRRTQNYDFLTYVVDMIGPGISLSRKRTKFKWVKYEFPKKIKMLGETKRARELRESAARKIAAVLHCSKETAKSGIFPMLKAMYAMNPSKARSIMEGLKLEDEEVRVIVGKVKEDEAHGEEFMGPKKKEAAPEESEEKGGKKPRRERRSG
ncbi:MAG: replication factor C large subunit, partial [Fervidicoccaceae archaeon]